MMKLTDIEDTNKYTNISQKFGHFFLKRLFELTDEEVFTYYTDGPNDNDIDAKKVYKKSL